MSDNDMITRARHQAIEVHFDVAELTLANIVSEAQRLVEYARSKGAPDDAAIDFNRSPYFSPNDRNFFGPPEGMPHNARIMWREDEYHRRGAQ